MRKSFNTEFMAKVALEAIKVENEWLKKKSTQIEH